MRSYYNTTMRWSWSCPRARVIIVEDRYGRWPEDLQIAPQALNLHTHTHLPKIFLLLSNALRHPSFVYRREGGSLRTTPVTSFADLRVSGRSESPQSTVVEISPNLSAFPPSGREIGLDLRDPHRSVCVVVR